MSLFGTKAPIITMEDVEELSAELEILISETLEEATAHVLNASPKPEYMETIIRQALRLKDAKAGAKYIYDACQGEFAAILFVASQMVAGRVLDDADNLEMTMLRRALKKPFGKRWREFE